MLNIYYGPEYIDKSRFIFDNIEGRTLLLVPDQFSLQAERDAFFYLGAGSLMDLRIVDFTTLGHKVVDQTEGRKLPLIDRYGRHMLLTKIIGETSDDLRIYRHMGWKNSFIELVSETISEMKRYGASAADLKEAAEKLEDKGFLRYKLEDLHDIFSRYEKALEGKYLDSEDYITFYGERIAKAPMISEAAIWIYGFDTFTPKNMQIIERLLTAARSVNVVMTYDNDDRFLLTEHIMDSLRKMAEDAGVTSEAAPIKGAVRRTAVGKARELIAKQNSGTGQTTAPEDESELKKDFPVVLAELSDPYEEAERAAAYIQSLVRDYDYRYGEIVVVCNDLDGRGAILKRTLQRWNVPVFTDRKRKVTHHSAVVFLLSLMEIIASGYRSESVMRLVKSGLMGYAREDIELLENYAAQYRIRGTAWKDSFTRGHDIYDEEELTRIEQVRAEIIGTVEAARQAMGSRNRASEKIKGLYDFLDLTFGVTERIEEFMGHQEEMGLHESAAETAQSWNVICGILDQIGDTVGEERISNKELLTIMTAGFEEVEIGLVPVSSDCVIIGTLQRTRLSRIRALLVIGANEGVLPMGAEDGGLLSEREKSKLEELGFELSRRDIIARKEERIAIYRTMYMPQERLYISCSKSDADGKAMRPSEVFTEFRNLCPQGNIIGDLECEDAVMNRLTTSEGSLPYLARALRSYGDGEYVDKDWLRVMNWYEHHDPQKLGAVRRGLMFSNAAADIGEKFADELYRGDKHELEVSASQLEKYSGCPFAHFIGYGLRPDELGVYEIGARETGDIYHECLMLFSRKLMAGLEAGMNIKDENSPWMKISREECRCAVEEILGGEMNGYKEGLLSSGNAEKYRTARIIEICDRVAWAMVKQVRLGLIRNMGFEIPFGNGCRLPGIEVPVGSKKVIIRGKIDRMDILGGDTSVLRVIDYKTGEDNIDLDHIRGGYKLQLMIYLKAGTQQSSRMKPAGVFYFKIQDVDVNADTKNVEPGEEALDARIGEAYRLQGVMLDDPELIALQDMEMQNSSKVIPVKFSKSKGVFTAAAGGALLSEEEFMQLSEEVDRQIQRICSEICEGSIAVRPKREKKKDMEGRFRTACRYCSYRSICMFDTSFRGCRFENV